MILYLNVSHCKFIKHLIQINFLISIIEPKLSVYIALRINFKINV